MRPLIRSLFLLSLAASPLALAETPAAALVAPIQALASTATTSASVGASDKDAALVRSQVQELEATVDGMRRDLAQLREQEDARTRVIGDPNVHSLWP
jgi:hypothetical protein